MNILLVDLDGTLIKEDMQYIYIKYLLKNNKSKLLYALLYLFFDKIKFKKIISTNIFPKINCNIIQQAIDYVNNYPYKILITGSCNEMVRAILPYINISFDKIITSDSISLTGQKRYEYIKNILKIQSFDYIGNEIKDIYIWDRADKKIAVVKANSKLEYILDKRYSNIHFIYRT